MGVEFPHAFRKSSHEGNVSDKNLNVLVKTTKKNDVLTTVAAEAFKEFQAAKIGVCHHVTKFCASVGAYAGAIAVPVGAVCGGTYWAFKEHIDLAVTNPSQSFANFTATAWKNDPLFNETTPIVGPYAAYTTPAYVAGAMAGLAALDIALEKALHVKPIRTTIKWSAKMVSSIFLYAAYKAGEMTTRHFELKEKVKLKKQESAQQQIRHEEQGTFDALAERLMERAEEVNEHPRLMGQLKRDVMMLDARMTWIRAALKSYGVGQAEVQQLLDKLSAAIQAIKSMKFELRVPKSEADTQHNIEFLKMISDQDFAKKGLAVPTSVKEEYQRASEATLGVGQIVKGWGAALLKSTITGLGTAVILPAAAAASAYAAKEYGNAPAVWDNGNTCYASLTSEPIISPISSETLNDLYQRGADPEAQCSVAAGAAAATVVAAVLFSSMMAGSVLSRYSREREEARQAQAACLEKADGDLASIYSQMANHLQNEKTKAQAQGIEGTPQLNALSKDAQALLKKIPLIKKQVGAVSHDAKSSVGKLTGILHSVAKADRRIEG